MSHPLRRVLILAAGALLMMAPWAEAARQRAAAPTPPAKTVLQPQYESTQLEAYLTDEGIAYIRPGFNIKVESVTIPSDRRPVIEVTITDNMNQPLDRLGQLTPGAISMSFILAGFNPETRLYNAYTTRTQNAAAGAPNAPASSVQASADSQGTFTNLSLGRYSYKFRAALPEGYSQSQTLSIGIYGSRNLTEQIGKSYYDNVVHDFRPDGGTVAANTAWDKIRDTSCNACHEQLAFHGGSRRDVKLCVMCHQPQTNDPDTGNSVDMAVMIHKIHAPGLQQTPYVIWGNQSSVHDYSHITFPQDVRNCETCHEGTTAANTPSQKDVYYTKPSRRACGACHSAVNFATGVGHPAQADDSQCATCHIPDSGHEFDASIKGAHTIPVESKQLKGLTSKIVSVSNAAAGQKPTIVFEIRNADGTFVNGKTLATFAPIHGGPTSDYRNYYREDARTAATYDANTGRTTYTFTNAIPAGSTGTWGFTADIYRNAEIVRADDNSTIALREAVFNPVFYSAITGAVAPAASVVTTEKCVVCHEKLELHGGQRQNVSECLFCHNGTQTDASRRPADQKPDQSISMELMIHRIHTGHELTKEFTVYGFGNTPHDYTHVTYPQDRRNCVACHASAGTTQLPVATASKPVLSPRDYFSPMGKGTAACLGCHDSRDAAAHAYLNTTIFPGTEDPAEACGVCHGPNADWAVDKVHAR
jgi:OmcA/MtrC family decaheme c-type cytochrome